MGSGKKEHTYVTPPDMIADYNSSLGGVDLADMLIALYRTEIVSKKQWLISARSKVGSCIAVIVISRAFSKKKKNEKPLLEFITSIANSLQLSEKIPSSGRPKKRSLSPTTIVGRKAAVPKPMPDVRYDSVDNFPEFNEKRNRCCFCPV